MFMFVFGRVQPLLTPLLLSSLLPFLHPHPSGAPA
jgi:hypothetical protein